MVDVRGLYKVSRCDTDRIDYDEFDSFVCVAEDIESARRMHPRNHYVWNKRSGGWHFRYKEGNIEDDRCEYHGWTTDIKGLVIEYMGPGVIELPVGRIILASFNAG